MYYYIILIPHPTVIKSDNKGFSSCRRIIISLHENQDNKLCDTFKATASTNIKTVHQTSFTPTSRATSIDSDCCRLPTTSVRSNKADKSRDLPICSPWTFRENHSPNIIYTVNRRNQPTAMDLYFLDWVRTRYKTEPEAHTKSAHTVL